MADKRSGSLVILLRGGIGDLLVSTPFHRALKEAFPSEPVSVMCREAYAPLLEGNPWIDELIPTVPQKLEEFFGFYGAASRLKKSRFQRVFVLWSKAPEAWLAFFSGIPVRVGQGSRLGYSFLYTHKVRVASEAGDEQTHWSEILLDYLRALGVKPHNHGLVLHLSEAEKRQARELLLAQGVSESDLPVGFHPGKGVGFTPHNISVEHLAALADKVAQLPGVKLIFTGSENEMELVQGIREKMGEPSLDFCGKVDLRGLAGLISQEKVLICPDSGPMHMGAALGVKIAAIFALRSDFPERWAPYGVPFEILRPLDWDCRGHCVKENCPYFSCYQKIKPADLQAAVRRLLA